MKRTITSLILVALAAHTSQAQTITLQDFASGFTRPVEITHPSNDTRLFVVEQSGKIKILNQDGTVNSTPFLDLTTLVEFVNFPGTEQGLLGLAFHPDYATNGYFYVNYTRSGDGATVISRYSVSGNPDVANTSGTILLTITQPFTNHNGGTIKFGPDGYLYIGMGDGGSGGDPNNNAQNINENLGKMLRIDVNTGSPYSSPATNPYVGVAGNDEIWSIGMRNPWKFSFNRLNGDLWIADVGQFEVEEINKIASPLPNSGLNFGWRCYEGSANYDQSAGDCPTFAATVDPFAEYTHSGTGGCSITGGYYYTGSSFPAFNNKYFFADYCTRKIGYVTDAGTMVWSSAFTEAITSFGEDKNGELYVTGGTKVYKMVDGSVSVSEYNNSILVVSPNPVKDEITITITGSSQIEEVNIIDLSGKVLYSEFFKGESKLAVTTQELSEGLYILSVKDNNGAVFQTKLKKQ